MELRGTFGYQNILHINISSKFFMSIFGRILMTTRKLF